MNDLLQLFVDPLIRHLLVPHTQLSPLFCRDNVHGHLVARILAVAARGGLVGGWKVRHVEGEREVEWRGHATRIAGSSVHFGRSEQQER